MKAMVRERFKLSGISLCYLRTSCTLVIIRDDTRISTIIADVRLAIDVIIWRHTPR